MFRFLLLFLLLSMPLQALAVPVVETEVRDYNFGEVSQGDKVSYTFRFRNGGDELLEISSVHSSCGCTAALLSSKRILPGDTGEVKATFDSSRFRGTVTKSITLKTNAPAQQQVVFRLMGTVRELLSLSNPHVSWLWRQADQEQASVVRITNHSKEPITLQSPQVTHQALTAELDRRVLNPEESATLSLRGQLPKGEKRLNAYVLIKTDFKPMPQLRIAVSGRLAN